MHWHSSCLEVPLLNGGFDGQRREMDGQCHFPLSDSFEFVSMCEVRENLRIPDQINLSDAVDLARNALREQNGASPSLLAPVIIMGEGAELLFESLTEFSEPLYIEDLWMLLNEFLKQRS